MFRFLTNLLPAHGRRSHSPSSRRRVQLGLEVLEGRALPSTMMPLSLNGLTTGLPKTIDVAPVKQVANLQGYSFHLISSSGALADDLVIQTETFRPDGSANFTAAWGQGLVFRGITNGRIWFDATGKMKLSFSCGTFSFLGTLTPVANPYYPALGYFYGAPYHLDGNVTSSTGGVSLHFSGDGTKPTLTLTLM